MRSERRRLYAVGACGYPEHMFDCRAREAGRRDHSWDRPRPRQHRMGRHRAGRAAQPVRRLRVRHHACRRAARAAALGDSRWHRGGHRALRTGRVRRRERLLRHQREERLRHRSGAGCRPAGHRDLSHRDRRVLSRADQERRSGQWHGRQEADAVHGPCAPRPRPRAQARSLRGCACRRDLPLPPCAAARSSSATARRVARESA